MPKHILAAELQQIADGQLERDRYRNLYRGVASERTAVALRFDDNVERDYTYTLPKFTSRNLVAGFAVVSSLVGQGGRLTAAQMLTMQDGGMEMICHSATHATVSSYTDTQFLAETVTAANTLRALTGIQVQSFAVPGTWSGSLLWDSETAIKNSHLRILQSTFAHVGGWIGSNYRSHPMTYPWGTNVLASDTLTLAQLQTYVNNALRYATQIEFLFHSNLIGSGGSNISEANFESFLDYLVTKSAVGLTVLTPTGLAYAQPNTTPYNVINDGNFEISVTGTWRAWEIQTGAPTVEAGGRTGNCASVNDSNSIVQYFSANSVRSVRFTGYAKAVTGSATAAVILRDGDGHTLVSATPSVTDAGWTKVTLCAGLDSAGNGKYAYLWLLGNGAAYVLWDDIKLERI